MIQRLRGTLRHRVDVPVAGQLLFGWGCFWFALMRRHGGVSWHFFVEGATFLFAPGGGLHLYAAHPELQIGPLAFVLSGPLAALPPAAGLLAVQALLALLGVFVLVQLWRLGNELRPPIARTDAGRRLLLAGIPFLPVWMNLAVRFVHVDDALALALVACAVGAIRRGEGVLAGIMIGMSVDAKPWALPFAGLLLALRLGGRIKALLAAAATVAVAWLPFLLADPATLAAGHFTIVNQPDSSLRTLGVSAAVTPGWDRPAQVALGLALAVAAVRAHRWAAAVLLVVAARVVLDPGTYTYYVAGISVGALVWDQVGTRRALPVFTWFGAGLFASEWLPLTPAGRGLVRLVFVVACVAFLAARPRDGVTVPVDGSPAWHPDEDEPVPPGPRHPLPPPVRAHVDPGSWTSSAA